MNAKEVLETEAFMELNEDDVCVIARSNNLSTDEVCVVLHSTQLLQIIDDK
jgi:hypothetical protein